MSLYYLRFVMQGTNYTGMEKTNQDSFSVHSPFAGCKDSMFFGVFDGHGLAGHAIAKFMSNTLPAKLHNLVAKLDSSRIEEKIVKEAFDRCQADLEGATFDSDYSGTTCTIALIQGSRLFLAATGDSRLLIGRHTKNEDLKVFQPIRDHKPDLPDEQKRILEAGGAVAAYKNRGPARVWLSGEEDVKPGLAMSRSLGDSVAHSVGVSHVPECHEEQLDEDVHIVVLCSDGISEHMSNEDVMEVCSKYTDPQSACEQLVAEAVLRWDKHGESLEPSTMQRDDITVLVLFLTFESQLDEEDAKRHENRAAASRQSIAESVMTQKLNRELEKLDEEEKERSSRRQ